MAERNKNTDPGHVAKAKVKDISVSAKQCIEICRNLRYKSTIFAKKYLEEVIALKRAVPYRSFVKDTGHKRGMASGRFPRKAAAEFLRMIQSVEANAHAKGLDTANLKITKLLANKASIPFTGGRQRSATKRSHLEIEVREGAKRGKMAAGKSGAGKGSDENSNLKEGKPVSKAKIKVEETKVKETKIMETKVVEKSL